MSNLIHVLESWRFDSIYIIQSFVIQIFKNYIIINFKKMHKTPGHEAGQLTTSVSRPAASGGDEIKHYLQDISRGTLNYEL